MIKWYNDLYIGKKLLKYRIEDLKKKIEDKEFFSAYLITLSTNESNQFDIVSTMILRQKWIYDSLPMIVGVSADKAEATAVLCDIMRDCISRTGCYDMRAFVLNECRDDIC